MTGRPHIPGREEVSTLWHREPRLCLLSRLWTLVWISLEAMELFCKQAAEMGERQQEIGLPLVIKAG